MPDPNLPLVTVAGQRRKAVALTFDDGPGPATERILETLSRLGTRATFFVTGENAERRPDVLRRIRDAGHVIGNHSYSHPQVASIREPRGHFDEMSDVDQRSQIERATEAISSITGQVPLLFRGPAGRHFSSATTRIAASYGLTVTHWTYDTGDWRSPATIDQSFVDKIVSNAIGHSSQPKQNPIVLMHDAKASDEAEDVVSSFRGNTIAAVGSIVMHYVSNGYEFTDPLGNRL